MPDYKFVAYIDILGFKEMVKNQQARKKLASFQQSIYDIWRESGFQDDRGLNGLAYSDSLTIYSQNDTPESLSKILDFVGQLYRKSLFKHNIMLRGGLDKGEFDVARVQGFSNLSKNQFFGQAFIDAYLLESNNGIKGCRFVFGEDIKQIIKTEDFINSIKFGNLDSNNIFDYFWVDKSQLLENDNKRLNSFYSRAEKEKWTEHYTKTLDLFCLIAGIDNHEIIKQKLIDVPQNKNFWNTGVLNV